MVAAIDEEECCGAKGKQCQPIDEFVDKLYEVTELTRETNRFVRIIDVNPRARRVGNNASTGRLVEFTHFVERINRRSSRVRGEHRHARKERESKE